jgi:hypothetical protein
MHRFRPAGKTARGPPVPTTAGQTNVRFAVFTTEHTENHGTARGFLTMKRHAPMSCHEATGKGLGLYFSVVPGVELLLCQNECQTASGSHPDPCTAQQADTRFLTGMRTFAAPDEVWNARIDPSRPTASRHRDHGHRHEATAAAMGWMGWRRHPIQSPAMAYRSARPPRPPPSAHAPAY